MSDTATWGQKETDKQKEIGEETDNCFDCSRPWPSPWPTVIYLVISLYKKKERKDWSVHRDPREQAIQVLHLVWDLSARKRAKPGKKE